MPDTQTSPNNNDGSNRHNQSQPHSRMTTKQRVYDIIFGFDTKAGRLFDIVLICLIGASVLAVMLDSVLSIHQKYTTLLFTLEWIFTICFTIEYALRIYSSPKPRSYIFSFYGIIDLLSILPTYIAFLFPAAAYLIIIRILRVLRIFRILKMFRYIGEADILFGALLKARRKIFIFMFTVLILVTIFGTMMFIIEGPQNGFSNIPQSMYWAIVTITTVGYGDISPHTALGQAIAALAMICGYAIIAVPTGIIGAEILQEFKLDGTRKHNNSKRCGECGMDSHANDASFCRICGSKLTP